MYEKALKSLLDNAISENMCLHDVGLVLQRAMRNLIAAMKVSQAAVTTEDSITVEGEAKHETTAKADVKVTLLDNGEMQRKKYVSLSKKQRLLKAMTVELEQTTIKSMLTELRQLVLVGCEV